jgi:hypothetical protein
MLHAAIRPAFGFIGFVIARFGLDINSIAMPQIIIYLVADGSSITGGWFSSYLIRKGWSINRARKFTLLMCALIIMPVMFVTKIKTGFKITSDKTEQLSETRVKMEGKLVNEPHLYFLCYLTTNQIMF